MMRDPARTVAASKVPNRIEPRRPDNRVRFKRGVVRVLARLIITGHGGRHWLSSTDLCPDAHRAAARKSAAAALTKAAILRNVTIAERLGCLDTAGLEEMRKGHAATVQRGPYAGDELSVDHVIPRAVVPELDNVIANLELLPQRANSRKNSTIGSRQRDLAEKMNKAGLLSDAGLKAVRMRR